MKKPVVVRRPKFTDERYLGPEPRITENATKLDFIRAYNWLNYFFTTEDAKGFVISYLKRIKYDKDIIAKISKADAMSLRTAGWNCRLAEGGTLPPSKWEWTEAKIKEVAGTINVTGVQEEPVEKATISIQDRINLKASDLIGELEEQLDVFFKEGIIEFNLQNWLKEKNIKPVISKKISDHFKPNLEEIKKVLEGTNKELADSYSKWRMPVLKVMALFISNIIQTMDNITTNVPVKKPRKKKAKPASVIVAKLKYKKEEGKLKSVVPTEIVGANQLWVYNTKYRNLSVYNADGPSGLSVKGTSIIGFDEKTSLTKKLRKPDLVLQKVLKEGKVGLRKIMTDITTSVGKTTGRINEETLLLRSVR